MKHVYPHTAEEVKENRWEEIDKENATFLLECVPPAKRISPAFAVGEPKCHIGLGWRPVHDCVVRVDGRYFIRPEPLDTFDPERFVAEVRTQLVFAEDVSWLRTLRADYINLIEAIKDTKDDDEDPDGSNGPMSAYVSSWDEDAYQECLTRTKRAIDELDKLYPHEGP